MNISAILPPLTFEESAVAGDQITKVVTVSGVTAENVNESATFTATLGTDTASAPVPVIIVAPSTPSFTVSNTASVSFEVVSATQVTPGTYEVTIVATKL